MYAIDQDGVVIVYKCVLCRRCISTARRAIVDLW